MTEGLSEPVGRVRITHSGVELDAGMLREWGDVQLTLCAWTAKGCAVVERDGAVLDLATLAKVSAQDLGGAELLILHAHVATQYPWLVRPA